MTIIRNISKLVNELLRKSHPRQQVGGWIAGIQQNQVVKKKRDKTYLWRPSTFFVITIDFLHVGPAQKG